MFRTVKFLVKEFRHALFYIAIFVCADVLVFMMFANVAMLSELHTHQTLADVSSPLPVAIVFGGGMRDGEMSDMQTDRIVAGVDLYTTGKAQKLLLTGDDGARRFDEVSAMFAYAQAHGVPAENLITDWHGYRTYDSCWRARNVFGVTKAMVVSQNFHLARIAYFCSKQGIEAIPVSADRRIYSGWWTPVVREMIARTKGWWDAEVSHPVPALEM